jgi:hypothetical protein
MNGSQPIRGRHKTLADFLGLAVLAYTAPLIGWLLYILISASTSWSNYNPWSPRFLLALVFFSVPTVPTFLILLPFRQRQLYRWLAWGGCVVFWLSLLLYLARL